MLLHISAKHNIAVGSGSRDHVCLVVLAMPHDVSLDGRGPRKNDLSTCREDFGILGAGECSGCEASAIEHDFGRGVGERGLDIGQLLSDKTDSEIVAESMVEELEVFGCVDGQGCERYGKPYAFWQFRRGNNGKLC